MVKQNAGLDREILSAGLSMAQNKLAHKAVEAGT
jgi:putative transposase